MRLQLRKPFQTLHKAYARQAISQSQLDIVRRALTRMISRVDEKESEEYQKTIVAGFLQETFYDNGFQLDTTGKIDLVIQLEDVAERSATSVWIETRKVYAGEMITPLKNNVKSLHELILRYFEACDTNQSPSVCQLIITDVYNWFLFEEADFRRFFFDNPRLKKIYQIKQLQQKDDTFFYAETARILRELDATVPVTYLNLREAVDSLKRPSAQSDRLLIPIVKLFLPDHLLKRPTQTSNELAALFYSELLHMVGVQEVLVKKDFPRLERLPEESRLPGSMLEQTMGLLRERNLLSNVADLSLYGADEIGQLFGVGFSLCVTWTTRILFLKLAERKADEQAGAPNVVAQALASIHSLLNANDTLIKQPYGDLFAETELEQQTLRMADLVDAAELPLFSQTILAAENKAEPMAVLPYLLAFCNAYTFLFDKPAEILPDSTPAITYADVSEVLDKISRYDGRSSCPQAVTSYMVRDVLRRAVIDRFNERFSWQCKDLEAIRSELNAVDRPEANAVMNSLRIVDPAAGSGGAIRAALHELIVIKSQLGILLDTNGRNLQPFDVEVVNGELMVTNSAGEPFDYVETEPDSQNEWKMGALSDRQRIQQALVLEKQTLLETCLFGVENNPVAATVFYVRFWLELLKNSPWPVESRLPIRLVLGNSLVSRFGLDFRIESLKNPLRDKVLSDFRPYVSANQDNSEGGAETEREHMSRLQVTLEQVDLAEQKPTADIRKLEAQLAQPGLTFGAESPDEHKQKLLEQLEAARQALAHRQQLFRQAVEWRFIFPDVLDDTYAFTGFDVVIGNPPSYWQVDPQSYSAIWRKAFPGTYARKSSPYTLLMELGLKLLRPDGLLAYSLPTKWTKAGGDARFRKWLDSKAVEQIVDFNELQRIDDQEIWPSALIVRHANEVSERYVVHIEQVDSAQADVKILKSISVAVEPVSPTSGMSL